MDAIVEKQIQIALSGLAEEANVPINTGQLRRAIKYRKVGPGSFQVYIDETEAPYAGDVEAMAPFWDRVAMTLSYRLASSLGGESYREDIPDAR